MVATEVATMRIYAKDCYYCRKVYKSTSDGNHGNHGNLFLIIKDRSVFMCWGYI